jgi:hypothetical protein
MDSDIVNKPGNVGFNRDQTLKQLPEKLREYIEDKYEFADWYSSYAKNFRDASAHRIPAYIAPYSIEPKNADRYKEIQQLRFRIIAEVNYAEPLGPLFKQLESLDEEEHSFKAPVFLAFNDGDNQPVIFHPQIICDLKTINKLLKISFPKLGEGPA